jgi:hypothetical protein
MPLRTVAASSAAAKVSFFFMRYSLLYSSPSVRLVRRAYKHHFSAVGNCLLSCALKSEKRFL